MLKRLMVMTLVSLYSISAIGVPLHYHYCKGELQHISVLTKQVCEDTHKIRAETLGCCQGVYAVCEESGSNDACCDDRSQLLSVEDEQLLVSTAFPDWADITPVVDISNVLCPTDVDNPEISKAIDSIGSAKYLMFCALIFYG